MGCLGVKILTPYVDEVLIKGSYLIGDVYIFILDLEIFCFHCGCGKLASGVY